MALRQELKDISDYIQQKTPLIKRNYELIDIYNGNLKPYLLEDLKKELAFQSYEQAITRAAPINVLIKIIDKLSKIYQEPVTRYADPETDLVSWYQKAMAIDQRMNVCNEYLNLFKYSLVQLLAYDNVPICRPIPNDRFLILSADQVNPTKPTHYIIFMGKDKVTGSDMFAVYTDDEFYYINERGQILEHRMAEIGADGSNPIGKAPFVYINKSHINLIPTQDSDTLEMTKLIPKLVTDLNYISKFTTFSIMLAIDANEENLTLSPNSVWMIKSEPGSEHRADFKTLKPEGDIDKIIKLIETELAFWLSTRGIKPGAIGSLSADKVASGVSKMIDEMDTTDARKIQVQIFTEAENDIWDLIINWLHPYWTKAGLIENRAQFPNNCKVYTKFAEQAPQVSRLDTIQTIKTELEAGFITQKMALQRAHPHMTDKEIEKLANEINSEKVVSLPIMEDEVNGEPSELASD